MARRREDLIGPASQEQRVGVVHLVELEPVGLMSEDVPRRALHDAVNRDELRYDDSSHVYAGL